MKMHTTKDPSMRFRYSPESGNVEAGYRYDFKFRYHSPNYRLRYDMQIFRRCVHMGRWSLAKEQIERILESGLISKNAHKLLYSYVNKKEI